MQRLSAWTWVALAGAVLGFVSLGSNFYIFQGEVQSAWFGVPHTSNLILLAALTVVVLTTLSAAGRAPASGRGVGLIMGIVALVATLQLGYRMLVPPFGGCLHYGCGFDNPRDIGLEPGIWVGFAGTVLMVLGGFGHAFSAAARRTTRRLWVAERQSGMTPWLGLAAVAAVAQFLFAFSGLFTFYSVQGFPQEEAATTWSGWISIPHTASMVLATTVAVLGLAWAASRNVSPLRPGALGGVIAILGFVAFSRILYRMLDSPWNTAGEGGGDQVHTAAEVSLGWAPFLSLAGAAIVTIAGIAQAVTHRDEPEPERPRAGRHTEEPQPA
jgi:hypothetical protein